MKFLIYLLPFLVLSCGSRLKSVSEINDLGYKTTYSIDPETKLKEGLVKVFDADGNLYEETNYSAGKINGTRTLYYPNGKKEVLENMVADEYQGLFQSFYKSGSIKVEGMYEKSIAFGKWKTYYENGQLKDIATLVDNAENGPFIEYHENGNLKAEGNFKDGDNEDGILLLYDKEGQLEKKMDCKLGRCSTIWRKSDQKS